MDLPKIIEGQDVDVISPFPAKFIKQAVAWLHCHPTLTMADNSPKDEEGLLTYMEEILHNCPSYAIVDKYNLTRVKSTDTPLVGIVTVQPLPPWSAYVHIASTRKAWGEKLTKPGLLEQGSRLIIEDLFANTPTLLRINASPLSHNAAAKGLCRRLGFRQDGFFEDAVEVQGVPKSVTHFGLLRSKWPQSQENH